MNTGLSDEEVDRQVAASLYHERMVRRNKHVEHGVVTYLVQSEPTLIKMTACPCGASFAETDGEFTAGSRGFFETMRMKERL